TRTLPGQNPGKRPIAAPLEVGSTDGGNAPPKATTRRKNRREGSTLQQIGRNMEYEVEIDRIHLHRATVRVNAASASEATRKAKDLASSDGVRWQQIDEQLEAVVTQRKVKC